MPHCAPTTSCTPSRCGAANARSSPCWSSSPHSLRRVERLRFSALTGRGSVARHDGWWLCEGDVAAARPVSRETWQTLPEPDTD